MSKREVVGVRHIKLAEVTVAAEPEVSNLDCVGTNIADQRRPDEKTIAVILNAARVVGVMKTSLNCIALAEEVTGESVGDVNF